MGWLKKAAGIAGSINPVAGAISGGLGLLGKIFGKNESQEDKFNRQYEQQGRLNEQAADINYKYNERAAEAAYARELDMYERTKKDQSYESQVKQMEDAGLSVGLMMSNGGGSGVGMGQTGGGSQGGGASGQSAGTAANSTEQINAEVAQRGLALQMSRQMAEIENIKASTKKMEADAKSTETGTETEIKWGRPQIEQAIQESRTRVGLIAQQAESEEAKQVIMGQESQMKQIETDILRATADATIESARLKVTELQTSINKMNNEIEGLKTENRIKSESADGIIRANNLQAEQMIIGMAEKITGMKFTEEQINNAKRGGQILDKDILYYGNDKSWATQFYNSLTGALNGGETKGSGR